MKTLSKFSGLLLALTAAFSVNAQTGALEIKSQAMLEKTLPSGEKKLVVANSTVPGTELVYVTTFKNLSNKAVDNVTIDNPVPAEITYKADSAVGQNTSIVFSVDHGKTFGKVEQLKVTSDNGQLRPAVAKDVTNVRWVLAYSLKPNQEGSVSYKGVLK